MMKHLLQEAPSPRSTFSRKHRLHDHPSPLLVVGRNSHADFEVPHPRREIGPVFRRAILLISGFNEPHRRPFSLGENGPGISGLLSTIRRIAKRSEFPHKTVDCNAAFIADSK
jgi:hypothetical protein